MRLTARYLVAVCIFSLTCSALVSLYAARHGLMLAVPAALLCWLGRSALLLTLARFSLSASGHDAIAWGRAAATSGVGGALAGLVFWFLTPRRNAAPGTLQPSAPAHPPPSV